MRTRGLVLDGLHLLARLVPGVLLLWAGASKALDRQGSILAVSGYDALPAGLVEPVAIVLPWIELVLGLLLVLGLYTRVAGIGTAVLMSAFVAGMLQAKARGLSIDCGCFGGGGAGDGVSWIDILRDLPLLAAGVFLAARPQGPWRLDNDFQQEVTDDGDLIEAETAEIAESARSAESQG
jgi:uncharacterized membrane protein YphA (DoxX/SURF4 family)